MTIHCGEKLLSRCAPTYLNPPRVWNLSPLTTKNRPRGWNLTPLEGLGTSYTWKNGVITSRSGLNVNGMIPWSFNMDHLQNLCPLEVLESFRTWNNHHFWGETAVKLWGVYCCLFHPYKLEFHYLTYTWFVAAHLADVWYQQRLPSLKLAAKAPENGWLESFPFGTFRPIFQGVCC